MTEHGDTMWLQVDKQVEAALKQAVRRTLAELSAVLHGTRRMEVSNNVQHVLHTGSFKTLEVHTFQVLISCCSACCSRRYK